MTVGLNEAPPEVEAATEGLLPEAPPVALDAFDDDDPTVRRPDQSLPSAGAPLPPLPAPVTPTPPPVAEPIRTEPPASPVVAPTPVPAFEPEPPPPPAKGGGSLLPSAFLLLCAFGGTLLGFALFLGPGRVLMARVPDPEPVAVPFAPVPDPGPIAPEPEPSVAAVDDAAPSDAGEPVAQPDAETSSVLGAGIAEFAVDNDLLRKLQVRCAAASANGASPLQVELDGASACTITAIYEDRSRATAVLDSATPGQRYLCFDGGANLCQPR